MRETEVQANGEWRMADRGLARETRGAHQFPISNPRPEIRDADVVVCHYNKLALPHVRWMALHSMAFLMKERPEDFRVVLADGSPTRDETLACGLGELGVEYLHTGGELSFAKTYNAGIRRTSSPVVVAMANDVLIEAKQVRMLIDEMHDGVGCVFPYLSASDYGAQRHRRWPVPRRCFPTRMTLNVNAFPRAALEKVGLIPEQMTGCFNDVLLFIRLREAGYSIVLRNVGRVIHLGQQTLKTGATSVAYGKDEALFASQYSDYWSRRGGTVLFHRVAQRWTTRGLYRLVERMPGGLVRRLGLWNLAWAVEPYVCAESGTFGEGVRRILAHFRF